MKKFLIIQVSCIVWSSLIGAFIVWNSSSDQHMSLKTLSLYDESGVRRMFIGVPPGRANPPSIQVFDPSGEIPLLQLAGNKEGAAMMMLDKSGESALEINVANQQVTLHGRNRNSNGGIHLSVKDNVPLIALANQEEKPQIGLCVTEKGGQLVMGDSYGLPSLALISQRKDSSLVLQDVISNSQKSITYNSDTGLLTFRDSKDGNEMPLNFLKKENSKVAVPQRGRFSELKNQRVLKDSDYLKNVKTKEK